MTRVRKLGPIAACLLLFGGAVADAAPAVRAEATATATVTAVTVVPGTGRAEVVLSFAGSVAVSDFVLESPHRIVVDLKGATIQGRAPTYDRVNRAGIRNLRLAQYEPDVVRLVLDLDAPRQYEVVRGTDAIRISVLGEGDFAPWSPGTGATRAPSPERVTPIAEVAEPDWSVTAASEPTFQPLPSPVQGSRLQASEQRRITVTFANRDIHDVIATFAEHSGKTFVTGSSVQGTIRFTEIINQPWDIALQKILQANGLQAMEDSTGIITIDSYKNLAARVAAEPLVTQLIVLNYAKAAQLAITVRQLIAACSSGSVGSESTVVDVASGGDGSAAVATPQANATCGRGVVTHEEKTNTLLITETVSRLPEIVRYVKDLDVRTPQVAIKAKIIAVDRTATEEMGLSYDFGNPATYINTLNPRGTPGEFTVNLGGEAFVGVGNANRTYGSSAAITLIYNTVFRGNNITAFLDALSSQSLSDVQAEPSTTTIDNRKAELFAGTEISFLLTPPVIPGQIQAIAPVISQKKIGITLAVTPHVTANRQVAMEINATQQTLLGVTVAGPDVSERAATNEVLVADGETAVIAGLTQTQVTRVERGIPILSKIPWIGVLFRETSVVERKQDLLILVTPHIVDEGEIIRRPDVN